MENFLGEKQFTASLILTTKTYPKKVLLLHHKKLGTWVQIGGHIEHTENPIEALLREVMEETGLDVRHLFSLGEETQDSTELPLPRFLLEEKIPQHTSHPAHFHIDLIYHREVDNELPISILEKEAHGAGWFRLEEALQLSLFENTKKMIKEVLA